MTKSGITAHMVVKNEDQWVWYAINSVLPYVDTFLITDTGSHDNTVKIVKSIDSPKIIFHQTLAEDGAAISRVRQDQVEATRTPWIWIVDGDEVYPKITAEEIYQATSNPRYEGIVVNRYDLLGDVYHKQLTTIGQYQLFGRLGHMLTRLVNKSKIKGLHYRGDYPLEGFYDGTGVSAEKRDPDNWYFTRSSIYHAMYLKRSSLGINLKLMLNRHKYRFEKGLPLKDKPPEILFAKHPSFVPNQLYHRSLLYELISGIVTPVKNIKRNIL